VVIYTRRLASRWQRGRTAGGRRNRGLLLLVSASLMLGTTYSESRAADFLEHLHLLSSVSASACTATGTDILLPVAIVSMPGETTTALRLKTSRGRERGSRLLPSLLSGREQQRRCGHESWHHGGSTGEDESWHPSRPADDGRRRPKP
jgi:hypothetical protein